MIATITIGAEQRHSVQGDLVEIHGARIFQTGKFDPNGRATVRVGDWLYTGKLVERT